MGCRGNRHGPLPNVNTMFYVETHPLLPLKKNKKQKNPKPSSLPCHEGTELRVYTEGLNLLMMSNLKAHNLSYPLSNPLHLLSLQEKIIIQAKPVISHRNMFQKS